MSERPPSPLAWRLALQQHSPARSVASPAGTAAGRGDDNQDGFFDLIRELALDLLDSVNTDSHSLCSGKQEKCTAHSGGELSEGIIEGALSEATTTTHSATDSVAVSPDNRSRDRSDWSLGLAASPGRLRIPLPIRNFPASLRPASVSLPGRTSAISSERRRRTRRSSENSSVLCELDTVDLQELDRVVQDPPACFTRQHRRPESAQAYFDHSSEGSQADCSLSPPRNRAPVRSTTSTGCIESDLASPTGVGSAGGSSRVSLRWTLRSPSRQSASGRSPCRPKSASGLPSYLRPSQSYLRSLQEHRPTTPGHRDRFAVSRGAPGPGAYTPVGFANPANHPTPARTWMHDAVPLNELHWHLKESNMKPDPGIYKVLGDPGNKSDMTRGCKTRSSPGWVFGREARVCTIASGSGVKSRHVQTRGDRISYDDVRMTAWRDWM